MSKERQRRRAQQRQKRAQPRSRPTAADRSVARTAKPVVRSGRERRRRQRLVVMAVGWGAVNLVAWLLTWGSEDPWSTRWVVLALSTMAVPVLTWLLWDPEGRVDL